MEIIEKASLSILQAKDGYVLRSIDDVFVEKHTDENGNEIEEHIPYYFKKAYVPKSVTLEEAEKLYVEEKDERSE